MCVEHNRKHDLLLVSCEDYLEWKSKTNDSESIVGVRQLVHRDKMALVKLMDKTYRDNKEQTEKILVKFPVAIDLYREVEYAFCSIEKGKPGYDHAKDDLDRGYIMFSRVQADKILADYKKLMTASVNFTQDPGDDKKIIAVPEPLGDHVFELRPAEGATIQELRDMSIQKSKWESVNVGTGTGRKCIKIDPVDQIREDIVVQIFGPQNKLS